MSGSRVRPTHPTHRRSRVLVAIVVALVLAVAGLLVPRSAPAAPSNGSTTYVEPAAGYGFFDHAVSAARHSIDLSMYELEDPACEAALVARARAGVVVRIVLDSAYSEASVNAPAARVLRAGGVRVTWAPRSQIFHAKYLITDGSSLYIGTGNLTAHWYSATRDFWVLDTNHADIATAATTFSADFSHTPAALGTGSGDLVWSPGSTNALVALIGSAKRTVLVECEEMDSYSIESALEAAAQRGVLVSVVMTYSSSWHSALARLAAAGAHVRVLATSQVYIHAKVICADCSARGGTVFVGSENFSTSSLEYNRELGLITHSASVRNAVRTTVLGDYALGTTNF